MIFFRDNVKKYVVVLLFSLNLPSLFASQFFHTNSYIFDVEQYDSFITLTGGLDFIKTGQTQTLLFPSGVENIYSANTSWKTTGEIGLLVGVERFITNTLSAQLGVSANAHTDFNPQGSVVQISSMGERDFRFDYHVQNTSVMLTSKILTTLSQYNCIRPYFSWEIGAGFNRPNRYKETRFNAPPVLVKGFSEKTSSSFAWGVGLGVDYVINKHLRAGLGYQFADLGSVSLDLSHDGINTRRLSSPDLYANQFRAQVTFMV